MSPEELLRKIFESNSLHSRLRHIHHFREEVHERPPQVTRSFVWVCIDILLFSPPPLRPWLAARFVELLEISSRLGYCLCKENDSVDWRVLMLVLAMQQCLNLLTFSLMLVCGSGLEKRFFYEMEKRCFFNCLSCADWWTSSTFFYLLFYMILCKRRRRTSFLSQ